MQSRAQALANGDLFVKAGLLDYIDKMPTAGLPVPPYLDWDLWIGPAPCVRTTTSIFPARDGIATGASETAR